LTSQNARRRWRIDLAPAAARSRTLRQQTETARAVLKLLWKVDRSALLTLVGTTLVNAIAAGLLLLLLKASLGVLLNQSGNLIPLVGLAAVLTVQQVMGALQRGAEAMLRQETSAHINTELLDRLQTVPYPMFEDNDFQATYGLLIREASYRPAYMVDVLIIATTSAATLFGVAVGLALVASPFVLLLVLLVIPSMFVETRYHRQLLELQTSSSRQLMRMQFLVQQSVDATWQRDFRVYKSRILPLEYAGLARNYLGRLRRLTKSLQVRSVLSGLATSVLIAVGLALAIVLVRLSVLTPAGATVMLTGLYLAATEARSLSASVGSLIESLGYTRRLFDFMKMDFSPTSASTPTLLGPDAAISSVQLESLSYRYPTGRRPALDTLSHTFGVGLTAVVGPNGAGKSTLIKVLAGLVPPESGKVTVNIAGGSRVALDDVPKAVLFQAPANLRMTFRENVTMEASDRSTGPAQDEPVLSALRDAGLAEVVQSLPEGLDTPLGAGFGGFTDLSGGQWQRLSVARLIYHDAPLILLDEPAASIDIEGEAKLLELLQEKAQTRVVIIVTHRYETVLQCEHIVVMSDGQIVETGSRDELVASEGRFFNLFLSRHRTGTWRPRVNETIDGPLPPQRPR
jgi:ATP-binding cassette subfamily B protein